VTGSERPAPVEHADCLFIDGMWVRPSSSATIDVIDSNDESLFYRVPDAGKDDLNHAVSAARKAFDSGPWSRLQHGERAGFLRAMAPQLRARAERLAEITAKESGAVMSFAQGDGEDGASRLEYFADFAETFSWEELAPTTPGAGFSLLVREPVGVVAVIIPWNAPMALALNNVAPALLAGCTVVLKAAPEAPGAAYVLAEAAEAAGLPAGVLNVVTAGREVSEQLVKDARVDKVSFTGSTATGRRVASLLGDRVARYTLELGGKSPAVVLDDADIEMTAERLAWQECVLTGQNCSSLTRIIVGRSRHDDLVEALATAFSRKRVGSSMDLASEMGPLVSAGQLAKVQGYVAKGVEEGAKLVTGGGRPAGLDRGYFMEPTVFAQVDNASVIAQEEIFGPVLSVIPAGSDDEAVAIANDTIFGLNSAVFTADVDRAREIAGRLRAGTVGHNSWYLDSKIAFGGFKQSGVGRVGGREGLLTYLETKTVILDGPPARYR
jgi:aldehyde dehydrogenase (NAD+)